LIFTETGLFSPVFRSLAGHIFAADAAHSPLRFRSSTLFPIPFSRCLVRREKHFSRRKRASAASALQRRENLKK